MESIVDLIVYLGLTPDKLMPVLISGGVLLYALGKWFLRPLQEEMVGIKKDIVEIKEEVTDLHHASKEMQLFLQSNSPAGNIWVPQHTLPDKPAWSITSSPLSLNPSGRKLLAQSGIGRVVESHLEELLDRIEASKPGTAYDVQGCSFEVLDRFVSGREAEMNRLKDFVYNNPELDGHGLDIPDVIYVGSMELRDKYLELHAELKGARAKSS